MAMPALLRVTQLDAIHLDNEIYRSIINSFKECSKYLPPGFTAKYEPEIFLLIKLFLLKCSIIESGSTFGQKLLAIKYTEMSKTKKILYVLLSNISYLKDRLEASSISPNMLNIINRLDTLVGICSFINLSLFLQYGKMPLLVQRILGLEQMFSQNVQRQSGSKYMTRELLWNGFIEVLVYVLPLVNYHKIKRVAHNLNPFNKKLTFTPCNERVLTVQTTCAHCKLPPIIPHHMGCPHIFCFTCLKSNQAADAKYECPVCEFSSEKPRCEKVFVKF